MSLRTLLALTIVPAILVGIVLWLLADAIPQPSHRASPAIEAER
ncbi:hypothetical protein [Devosia sp. RR2S18]|nr:hypothetical protein [Devosia sp. RR2S18]WIJ26336.1 hypothetical protein QOV41_06120 [Devosia sp. RR2S18]